MNILYCYLPLIRSIIPLHITTTSHTLQINSNPIGEPFLQSASFSFQVPLCTSFHTHSSIFSPTLTPSSFYHPHTLLHHLNIDFSTLSPFTTTSPPAHHPHRHFHSLTIHTNSSILPLSTPTPPPLIHHTHSSTLSPSTHTLPSSQYLHHTHSTLSLSTPTPQTPHCPLI